MCHVCGNGGGYGNGISCNRGNVLSMTIGQCQIPDTLYRVAVEQRFFACTQLFTKCDSCEPVYGSV